MMPTILLTNRYDGIPLEIINSVLPEDFQLRCLVEVTQEELMEKVHNVEYLLASGRLRIDRSVLMAAPKLKMIQRTGVGLDSLDLEAIKECNIPVYVNTGINASSVAEHTIMLMFAALRRLPFVHARVRDGMWAKQEQGVQNFDLRRKVIGLVGMGHIGQLVAEMLRSFDTTILYFDPVRLPYSAEVELGIRHVSFKELVESVDILSLHCPLTQRTKRLIGQKELTSMKPGSIIINTARGGLIDETALISCLESGQIGFAGLDVFETEPLPKESRLTSLDNVILTPHIGGITYDSFYAMMSAAMHNIELFEAGKLYEIDDRKLQL